MTGAPRKPLSTVRNSRAAQAPRPTPATLAARSNRTVSSRAVTAGNVAEKSTIDFHRGQILARIADTYSKLPQTLLEIIQNGFDASADRILVCIDLKQREVIVLDNGTGTDREKFEQALASVGQSIKRPGSLGKFGLGLVSPLTKCTSFTFTSSLTGQTRALQWTFRKADIERQRESLEIPCEAKPRMPTLPKRFVDFTAGEFAVVYRTEVHLRGVSTDRVTSMVDLDDLAYNIRTKFMVPMRDRKAVVRLVLIDSAGRVKSQDVNPLEYDGEPMPVVAYTDDDTGHVQFELYRARRLGGQRRGKVSIMAGNDNYPLTIEEFVAQARGRGAHGVISDAMAALTSGYFEGIIRCEKIELAANRKKFVYNDALEMLYLVIDQWYDEHGQAQHKGEQDLSRHTRWQELGLQSQNRLHSLLHQPAYANLWEGLLFVVEYGRIGAGHLDPENGKVNGPDDDRSIRVGQGGAGVERTPRPPSTPSTRQKAPATRDGDKPQTVSGPAGQNRRLVKGDSQGLQLAHAELPGDSRLWNFDFRDGTITFNTLHPVWVMLDETKGRHLQKNAKWILHLQEWLTIQVLNLLVHYPDRDEFERRRDIVDTQIRLYADLFIVGEPRRA